MDVGRSIRVFKWVHFTFYRDSCSNDNRQIYNNNSALYSFGLYFHHQSHPQMGIVFALAPCLHFSGVILHWSPVAYWTPTDLGSLSLSVLSFCLFILFMGFSRQEYWSDLAFPSPVDHILSELSTMTRPSELVTTPGEPGMQTRDPCLPWRGILGPGHTPRWGLFAGGAGCQNVWNLTVALLASAPPLPVHPS